MDDVENITISSKNWRIDRAPVPLFKVSSRLRRSAHIVLLKMHYVGNPITQHCCEGCFQIPDSGRAGVIWVVRKNVKEPATDDLVSFCHRGAQIGVAGSDDLQLWV